MGFAVAASPLNHLFVVVCGSWELFLAVSLYFVAKCSKTTWREREGKL